MDSSYKFFDHHLELTNFLDEILIICPKCKKMATVKPAPGDEVGEFAARRLTCHHCGLHRETKPGSVTLGDGPVDSYFKQPLFLVASQGTQVLWAYNFRHLEYIESFVTATLRARRKSDTGHANRSMFSRLPRWIKKASNRDLVLNLIEKLKRKMQGSDDTYTSQSGS